MILKQILLKLIKEDVVFKDKINTLYDEFKKYKIKITFSKK